MVHEVIGEFRSVTKRFGAMVALDGLSLKICRGINGLVGPNGAGKTTAIRLSLGLIKPDKGKAELFAFDCWRDSCAIRRRVGVLYEKLAFYDNLSGLEQLKLMAKLKGVSDSLVELKELLRLVELDEFAHDRRIGGYSAGMRQRLGIAQALLGDPELVILDEPTSNLDPLNRAKVLELIAFLNKEKNTSFLISSHILPELERVCSNFILMHKGKLLRQGTIGQMFDKSATVSFIVKVQPVESVFALLKVEEYVEDLSVVNDSLHVVVCDVGLFKQRLPLLISQVNASLDEVKMVKSDLETVFKSVVKED
ncbi:MAG: ABC transporter ATP-binding protein [Candidatus Bathyarchaeota archaeon]|uniref:ABC transporter ATP-binding protein n=1 Tax=Candidatus Bathycorpusculum sp. TaxID=2994959 RepID=UPI00282424CE|nr:ABC transporter ATP-binding protein [Candidatus Termiticorpusculum sp.]MCL2291861.1 ABC transporter ATP-binding protein [Candidatus Termiticorpusculum sp.]